MRRLILAIAALFLSAGPVHAEEIWACDGFVYVDGSQSEPFILSGEEKKLAYYLYGFEHVLKYVSEDILKTKLFVNESMNLPHFIREDGVQLEIQRIDWYSRGTANCYEQR